MCRLAAASGSALRTPREPRAVRIPGIPADAAALLIVTNIGPLMRGSCLMVPDAQSPSGLEQSSVVSWLVKSASTSWHRAVPLATEGHIRAGRRNQTCHDSKHRHSFHLDLLR